MWLKVVRPAGQGRRRRQDPGLAVVVVLLDHILYVMQHGGGGSFVTDIRARPVGARKYVLRLGYMLETLPSFSLKVGTHVVPASPL